MIDVDLDQVAIPLLWNELFGRNAPTDVELSEIDVVQPDLAVVASSRTHIISPSRVSAPSAG